VRQLRVKIDGRRIDYLESPADRSGQDAPPVVLVHGSFVLFGAPPVASPAQMGEAFLPNPAMGALFSAHVSEAEARQAAESFTAPGSTLDTAEFVSDLLATDGSARTGKHRRGSPPC